MRRIRSIALAVLLIVVTMGAAAPVTAAAAVAKPECVSGQSSCE
jgi:hypothetical protein